MTADKIKNVTAEDIIIGSNTIVKDVLTDLSSLDFSDGELKGKIFLAIENNEIEVYDNLDVIIDEIEVDSWNQEIDGEFMGVVEQTIRFDIIAVNDYINSL